MVDYGLNWKSLTQPAVLPLNTDYLPSIKELETNYNVHQYTISIDRYDSPFLSVQDALRELVCQRLSQVMFILLYNQHRLRTCFSDHFYLDFVFNSQLGISID